MLGTLRVDHHLNGENTKNLCFLPVITCFSCISPAVCYGFSSFWYVSSFVSHPFLHTRSMCSPLFSPCFSALNRLPAPTTHRHSSLVTLHQVWVYGFKTLSLLHSTETSDNPKGAPGAGCSLTRLSLPGW